MRTAKPRRFLRRFVLLSLDGLSLQQFQAVLVMLPEMIRSIGRFHSCILDTKPLVSAQAIWAELLTGHHWFENGCAGYSKPVRTLNALDIFGESDLLVPMKLLSPLSNLIVNIPLIKPADRSRIWLSDGSTSSNKTVSPRSLDREKPFSDYQPRPFASIVEALSKVETSLDACLETERIRLDCALELMKRQDWQRCFIRLSIFDHLAHLFGPSGFLSRDLQYFDRIRAFLSDLDNKLSSLLEREREFEVCIVSCFSHVRCAGRFNLNNLLKEGRFLQLHNVAAVHAVSSDRARRVAALNELAGQFVFPGALQSSEGLVATERTVAVSPVSGGIFINDKERFSDGIVAMEDFASTKERVANYIRWRLQSSVGNRAIICTNPQPQNSAPTPDIVVYVDGIELYNVNDAKLSDASCPRSTHAPEGFVYFPRKKRSHSSTITPVQLCELLNQ